MNTSSSIRCSDFPCRGVHHSSCLVPYADIDPARVSILLISEVAPADPADYYYAGENALFAQTTVLAFRDAGVEVQSVQDILDLGLFLTTAVKCAKTGSGPEASSCRTSSPWERSTRPATGLLLPIGPAPRRSSRPPRSRPGPARPATSSPRPRQRKAREVVILPSWGIPACRAQNDEFRRLAHTFRDCTVSSCQLHRCTARCGARPSPRRQGLIALPRRAGLIWRGLARPAIDGGSAWSAGSVARIVLTVHSTATIAERTCAPLRSMSESS